MTQIVTSNCPAKPAVNFSVIFGLRNDMEVRSFINRNVRAQSGSPPHRARGKADRI